MKTVGWSSYCTAFLSFRLQERQSTTYAGLGPNSTYHNGLKLLERAQKASILLILGFQETLQTLTGPPNACPEGPSTQYLRTLVPNTINSMVFGSRNFKYWALEPFGM